MNSMLKIYQEMKEFSKDYDLKIVVAQQRPHPPRWPVRHWPMAPNKDEMVFIDHVSLIK